MAGTRIYRAVSYLVPELRAAAMEGRCVNQHSQMFRKGGWRYCPWCGTELKIIGICPTCGELFLSIEAFKVHRAGHGKFYARNKCPNDPNHPVQFRKNRNRMYCPVCAKEYNVKEAK